MDLNTKAQDNQAIFPRDFCYLSTLFALRFLLNANAKPRAPADMEKFFKINANTIYLTSQRQVLILNTICDNSQFHPPSFVSKTQNKLM